MKKMVIIYMIVAAILSAIGTYLFKKYCERNKFTGVDMHKPWRVVAVSGGLPVLVSFILSILFYLMFNPNNNSLFWVPFILISMSLIMFIGLLDDFTKKNGGLSNWQKPLLTGIAVFPLLVLYPFMSTMINLPFIGVVELGGLSYLFVVAVFIGSSNMVNLLGGFNGLEAGLGLIYTAYLGIYALFHNNVLVYLISFIMFAAVLGFYYFNTYPSMIFPGDSLTYLLGAYIGVVATVGQMPVQAFFVSIPFFIEFVLKCRGKLQVQSFCKVQNNKIVHTGKICSLPHILGRFKKFTERQVVFILYLFELICCSLIWFV